MDIFGVLSFVGGLAMFLYGMSAMGDGLTKLSGGKLEYLLEKLTSKRIMAVLLGAGVTAVIQSSSATSVTVSYTHLRAHETVLDLECRHLHEK